MEEFEGEINRGDLIELHPEMMLVRPAGPSRVFLADNICGIYEVMHTATAYRVTCYRSDIKRVIERQIGTFEPKVGELVNVVERFGCSVISPNMKYRGVGQVIAVEECESLDFRGVKVKVGNNITINLAGNIESFHESDIHPL